MALQSVVPSSAAKDMTLSFRSRSAAQRSSSRNTIWTHPVSFPLRSTSFAHFLHNYCSSSFVETIMMSSALVTTLACVYVVGMKANHYPSAPQYTWGPRQTATSFQPLPQRPQQYYKGQTTAASYNSAPGFWYGGSAKGDNWNYNRLPVSAYSGGLYKQERADRPSALGTPATTEGRVSGKALAAGGYSRFTTSYQDPLHNRYGGFTLSPQKSQGYGSYGSYRNVGFYGAKGAPLPNYPPPGGQTPVNLQAFRGSRIYEGPVGLRHNQTKKTGVYVIPTPSKLYYDGVKN